MTDGEAVDPWMAAMVAQEERAAGLPPRPMLTREEAMAKADAHLLTIGDSDVAVSAWPNPLQGHWLVQHQDPEALDDVRVGGGSLVVPTNGIPYGGGSAPPWPEEIGRDEPEAWRAGRGVALLPDDWSAQLNEELELDYWHELLDVVAEERGRYDVFPPPSQTFAAFDHTRFADTRVVILGQDPYHGEGEAHGLAFSVPRDVAKPPSVRNLHVEMESDLGLVGPDHGNLEEWARQGVLLLNTVLTVRKDEAGSHRGRGWETFTRAVLGAVDAKETPVVFLLWGRPARLMRTVIDVDKHRVLEAPHPSPRSAYRGYFGSRPYSRTNELLIESGQEPIDWGRIGAPS